MKLASHNYGKQRVRVLRVTRGTPQGVKELEVGVRLEGDFQASYVEGDNRLVVATDTMKNTVQALAHRHLGEQTEPFLLHLAGHFLASYPQVGKVTLDARERRWSRLEVGGRPHDHSFQAERAVPVARVAQARGGASEIESGVIELLVMKCTGSGFSGFPRDSFTTLPEASDRILATEIEARWIHGRTPADYTRANAAILRTLLEVFAERYSVSVQKTLFDMASAALSAHAGLDRVALAMPNKHYLPLNLKPFGIDNDNTTFVPTDEPHGLIEAVVARS